MEKTGERGVPDAQTTGNEVRRLKSSNNNRHRNRIERRRNLNNLNYSRFCMINPYIQSEVSPPASVQACRLLYTVLFGAEQPVDQPLLCTSLRGTSSASDL